MPFDVSVGARGGGHERRMLRSGLQRRHASREFVDGPHECWDESRVLQRKVLLRAVSNGHDLGVDGLHFLGDEAQVRRRIPAGVFWLPAVLHRRAGRQLAYVVL